MNYKMILQYDGTKYDGWQKQGQLLVVGCDIAAIAIDDPGVAADLF